MKKLSPKAVAAATKTLSLGGKFLFTPRNLFYELLRREAWPNPERPRDALMAFRSALAGHEAEHGRLPGLVRAGEARQAVPPAHMPDVFDYSVRRVLVFDRVETFLLFAMNGFHRKIEVALLALEKREGKITLFPEHVGRRIERQLASGLRTAFYVVHDASRTGAKLRGRTRMHFGGFGKPRLADVGLSFAQAFRMGVPVRMGEARSGATGPSALEDQLLLASGNYAHLEELAPFPLMKFVYERIARGPDDLGFG